MIPLYNVEISTLDGGTVARESAFTISALPLKPTITSMLRPDPDYRNQTVNYTITWHELPAGQY